MSSLETLYGSLLLPAAGLIGLAVSNGSSNTAEEEPVIDRERDTIRVRNSVRLISSAEEGFSLERLPEGVYGYSYSPASEAVPLFARRSAASFEVHKPAASAPQVLGYLTEKEARIVESGELQDFNLYPEPHGDARTLVAIPGERVVRAKGPSRGDGNYLTVTVR